MKIVDFLTLDNPAPWSIARQLGIREVVAKLHPANTGDDPPWDGASLDRSIARYRERGFEIVALEGDPFPMDRIKLGLPGYDEDLEHYRQLLRNLGDRGIRLLCYNFMARIGWYRSRHELPERGGARVSGFYAEDPENAALTEVGKIPPEMIWKNYQVFLEAVLPVAEEAGVVLALHPDDPPIPELRGIGRFLGTADGFRKALALSESPSHRMTFCQANFSLMDEPLLELIHEFGSAGKIAYVHWRDVTGDRNAFRETFHDNGPTDMAATLRSYRDAGVDVPIRVDHVPALEEEGESTGYTTLGRLHAIGYLQGILEAVKSESTGA